MLLLLLSNNSNSYLGDGNVTAPVHTLELFITDKKAFISSSSVIDCCPLIFIVFVFDTGQRVYAGLHIGLRQYLFAELFTVFLPVYQSAGKKLACAAVQWRYSAFHAVSEHDGARCRCFAEHHRRAVFAVRMVFVCLSSA